MSRSNHEVMSYPKSQAPLGTDRSTDRRRERSTNGRRTAFVPPFSFRSSIFIPSRSFDPTVPLTKNRLSVDDRNRHRSAGFLRFPCTGSHRALVVSPGHTHEAGYGIAARREKLFPDPKRPMTEPQRLTPFPEDRTEQRAPSMRQKHSRSGGRRRYATALRRNDAV